MPPTPPAKPLRAQFQQEYVNMNPLARTRLPDLPEPQYSTVTPPQQRMSQQQPIYATTPDDFVQLRHKPALQPVAAPPPPLPNHNGTKQSSMGNGGSNSPSPYANMTRHTLHALSATPKPKLTNDWVQHRRSEHSQDLYQDVYRQKDPYLRQVNRMSESWALNQQKRKSDPLGFDYNSHWLIQEAEQRRLEQQRGVKSTTKKPLPDSVIQTITQRVQSLGIGERRR